MPLIDRLPGGAQPKCPGCGRTLSGFGHPGDEPLARAPMPGDNTFCMYCDAVLRFEEGMRLRRLTTVELLEMPYGEKRDLERAKKEALEFREFLRMMEKPPN